MVKRIIYTVTVPEQVYINQNEPPVPTHRTMTYPLVDCPMLDRGDKTPLLMCSPCPSCKDIKERYVECDYQQSMKEKDEIERRKKGVTQVMPTPPPQKPVETKEPGMPKNVFTKK